MSFEAILSDLTTQDNFTELNVTGSDIAIVAAVVSHK